MSFEAASPTVFRKIKTMPCLPVIEHDQWGKTIMGRLSENCLNKSCIPQGSIPRSLEVIAELESLLVCEEQKHTTTAVVKLLIEFAGWIQETAMKLLL